MDQHCADPSFVKLTDDIALAVSIAAGCYDGPIRPRAVGIFRKPERDAIICQAQKLISELDQ